MADDSKINSEPENNSTFKESESEENLDTEKNDDKLSVQDEVEETENTISDSEIEEDIPQTESSFEDEIDLDKEINLDDIDALQEKIRQSMSIGMEEFEEEDDDEIDSSVLKKYIVYISKDFVPLIDELSTNELSAYINDAIQKKLDLEEEQRQKGNKKRIITHIIIAILTTLIMTPILLYGAHKSMIATFENYKYSQDNFEKLYKQKFQKDKVYMRSLKYNKIHSNSSNKKSNDKN